MKKYLNNNLFYQGDANIFLPLCIVYIVAFILIIIVSDSYFSFQISKYLYNQMSSRFIFSFDGVFLLVAYIGIVYMVTVGIFKRKKWSTFLAGPFSRLDIRKRELIIIIISVIIFIGIYLSVLIKNYIQYYAILMYIPDFYKMIVLDIIRIISISTITIGCLSILDSIFSTLYYLIAAVVISFIYLIFILFNFSSLLSYYSYGEVRGLRYIYNGLIEYIDGTSIGNSITTFQIISMSIVFILIGLSLIYISKILTNKMLVENMNEGIILKGPKKVADFMIVTFPGVVSSMYISNIIDEVYLKKSSGVYEISLIRIMVIIFISILTYYILVNFKKSKKDVYYWEVIGKK